MNRIKQTAIFTVLLLPFFLIQPAMSQPSQSEAAKLFQPAAKASSSVDFTKIDQYVLGLKTKKNISEAELVKLITQQSQTKMEKARAIFIWLANNIAYDTSYKITSKEEALKQGKGVCEAYSGLFKSFGELAGLEVVSISGDTKQYYYKQPSDLDQGGHAWNAVKIDDGRWMIVDPTWGAGHVRNRVFTRKLSTHWFDPQPEIFIFTHLPTEDKWQLLSKAITRDEFLRLPPLSPELSVWGFNPEATFSYFIKTKNASFPDQFSIDLNWKIIMMPVCNELKAGKSYLFEFVLPHNEDVAIVFESKDFAHFEKDGDKFRLNYTPESKGQAILTVKQPSGKYGAIFKYEVID